MGRLALAAIVLSTFGAVAFAGPTRKISIDTEPRGATVYLDDVEKGPVCQETPCTFNAPLGTHTVIARLDKYEPEFTELDITRGKKPQDLKVKLKSALGTIVVDSPKGASVRVDDEDSGKAPTRVPVNSSDAHHVKVTLGGKTLFDDFVEVATGTEHVINTKGGGTVVASKEKKEEESEENSGSEQEIEKKAPSSSRSDFITLALAVDIGFRDFSYDAPSDRDLLRPESEYGQTIAGPVLEFWPGRLAGIRVLKGLSLYGRAQFNVLGQAVKGDGLSGTTKTSWTSWEASLRYLLTFGSFGIEPGVGYVSDSFSFTGPDNERMLMPAAEYQSLRAGLKLSYDAGVIAPYLAVENRIVLSGGGNPSSTGDTINNRFRNSSARGLRGALGVTVKLMPSLWARLEGALMAYSWEFGSDPMDMYQADGASDSVKLISILAAYTF